MKKALIMIIAAGMLMTGCADVNAQAETNGDAAQPAGTEGTAAPEVKTVYGEITELIGNAITVKEIEMPRFGGGRQFEVPLDENGNPDYSQMDLPEGVTLDENGQPDFSQIERPDGTTRGQGQMPEGFTPGEGMPEGFTQGEMPEGFTPGEMPEGFTPGDGSMRQGNNGVTPGAGGAAGEPDYTGEEFEIFIPVGLPITTNTTNDDGTSAVEEIRLDDLKVGDMITVTYKEDGATIASVFVSQAGTAGGGMMNGGMAGMPDGGEGAFFFSGPPGA